MQRQAEAGGRVFLDDHLALGVACIQLRAGGVRLARPVPVALERFAQVREQQGQFAPALAHLRAKTIDMRFEMDDLAEHAVGDRLRDGADTRQRCPQVVADERDELAPRLLGGPLAGGQLVEQPLGGAVDEGDAPLGIEPTTPDETEPSTESNRNGLLSLTIAITVQCRPGPSGSDWVRTIDLPAR